MPPVGDVLALWRELLARHANGTDGCCAVCGYGDCERGRWAGELLAEEDRWAAVRAAERGESERADGQGWRTSEGLAEAAAPPDGPVSPWDASDAAASQP